MLESLLQVVSRSQDWLDDPRLRYSWWTPVCWASSRSFRPNVLIHFRRFQILWKNGDQLELGQGNGRRVSLPRMDVVGCPPGIDTAKSLKWLLFCSEMWIISWFSIRRTQYLNVVPATSPRNSCVFSTNCILSGALNELLKVKGNVCLQKDSVRAWYSHGTVWRHHILISGSVSIPTTNKVSFGEGGCVLYRSSPRVMFMYKFI